MSEAKKSGEYYVVEKREFGSGEVYAVIYYYKGKGIVNGYFNYIENAQEKCDKLNDILKKVTEKGLFE